MNLVTFGESMLRLSPPGRKRLERSMELRVDGDELSARFERDYPGHGGRRRED